MDILEAIEKRHSVRSYTGMPISDEKAEKILSVIEECNAAGGLRFQLVRNEPKAFSSPLARYGKFSGVMDYIALVGKKRDGLEERCGYYGEKIVLQAQMIGLNTCWVGLTYKKIPGAFTVEKGEKLLGVISIGYGKTQGVSRKSKSITEICGITDNAPEWFFRGMEAVLLAPTAVNQQNFRFFYDSGRVRAEPGTGFYTKTDLGIAKYHFEAASGKGPEIWE